MGDNYKEITAIIDQTNNMYNQTDSKSRKIFISRVNYLARILDLKVKKRVIEHQINKENFSNLKVLRNKLLLNDITVTYKRGVPITLRVQDLNDIKRYSKDIDSFPKINEN